MYEELHNNVLNSETYKNDMIRSENDRIEFENEVLKIQEDLRNLSKNGYFKAKICGTSGKFLKSPNYIITKNKYLQKLKRKLESLELKTSEIIKINNTTFFTVSWE